MSHALLPRALTRRLPGFHVYPLRLSLAHASTCALLRLVRSSLYPLHAPPPLPFSPTSAAAALPLHASTSPQRLPAHLDRAAAGAVDWFSQRCTWHLRFLPFRAGAHISTTARPRYAARSCGLVTTFANAYSLNPALRRTNCSTRGSADLWHASTLVCDTSGRRTAVTAGCKPRLREGRSSHFSPCSRPTALSPTHRCNTPGTRVGGLGRGGPGCFPRAPRSGQDLKISSCPRPSQSGAGFNATTSTQHLQPGGHCTPGAQCRSLSKAPKPDNWELHRRATTLSKPRRSGTPSRPGHTTGPKWT